MGIKLSDQIEFADNGEDGPIVHNWLLRSWKVEAERLETLEESILETPVTLTEEGDSLKCMHDCKVGWVGYIPSKRALVIGSGGVGRTSSLKGSEIDQTFWSTRQEAQSACDAHNVRWKDKDGDDAIPWPIPLD